MKKQLKEQVVILATLLGLSDDETKAGITKCDAALKRHGLLKNVGNPHIKDVAKKVDGSLTDQLLNVIKKLTVTTPTTVKHIYEMIEQVDKDLTIKMSKWQCARLLTKLSDTSDLVVRTSDRGQNAFVFIKTKESMNEMKEVLTPVGTSFEVKMPDKFNESIDHIKYTPKPIIKSPHEIDHKMMTAEIESAKLRVQQADYYLKDIEENGEESTYFKGFDDITKTKADALIIIKNASTT